MSLKTIWEVIPICFLVISCTPSTYSTVIATEPLQLPTTTNATLLQEPADTQEAAQPQSATISISPSPTKEASATKQPAITITSIPSSTPTIEPTPDYESISREFDAVYADTVVFTNEAFGISFEYPRAFSGTECAPRVRSERVEVGGRIEISVYDAKGLSVQEYVDENFDEILFGAVSFSETRTVAGEPALYLEVYDNGFAFVHVIGHNDKIYVALLAGRTGCDSEWYAPIDDRLYSLMLNTLRFMD